MLHPLLNIEILPTYDSRVLLLADSSNWLHLEDEPTYIDITTPGRKKPVTKVFNKGKITIYNSNTLDLTCATDESGLTSLPDGIYTFKLYVCEGDQFSETVHYLRTVNLQVRLDNFLIKNTIDNCQDYRYCMELYFKMQLLLDGAHAHLRRGNIKRAFYNYEKALDMMDSLENCGCHK
jgi:hypothetical protein